MQIDPVRARRRQPIEPAFVVLVVAITFVGLALLKPWGAARPLGSASPPAARGSTVANPLGTTSPAPSRPVGSPFAPTAIELTDASPVRSAWGVRAVVAPGDAEPSNGRDVGLVERWLAIDVNSGAAWDANTTGTAVVSGDTVLALGVTSPDDALPLDVRFWRMKADATFGRIVPVPVVGPEPGSWLWLPSPSQATARGGWPAGTYRIDVLLAARIVRLITIVPAGDPALPEDATPIGNPSDLLDQLGALPPGPFSVDPRRPTAIDATAGRPLDEREAWLGPATGVLPVSAVGRVVGSRVSALGVLLDAGEELSSADLLQVAPIAGRPDIQVVELPPVPMRDGRRGSAVLVEYGDLRGIGTGVYRLSLTTTDASGRLRSRTWTIEIDPLTPPVPPGATLEQMARWIPLLRHPDRLGNQPLVSDLDLDDAGRAAGDGTCGGSAAIRPGDELIGIIGPAAAHVAEVRFIPIGTSRGDLHVRIAAEVAPGLTLVALPHGGLVGGMYMLDAAIDGGPTAGTRRYAICVG